MASTELIGLIRPIQILSPQDILQRAAGLMHSQDCSSILIADNNHIIGYVSEKAILKAFAKPVSNQDVMQLPLEMLVNTELNFLGLFSSLEDAAKAFLETESDVLPVIDEYGILRGSLHRHDLSDILTDNLRPPTIAGMATPLGVYLTSGSHRAGAGDFGLFLTGASMMFMILISSLLVSFLEQLVMKSTGISLPLFYAMHQKDFLAPLAALPAILNVVFMLLQLRWSRLSGYHGAEHMTVHAIEAGEQLSADVVKRMPRVHPRCGTNLLAAAGIFLIINNTSGGDAAVIIAFLAVMFGWKKIGGYLQSFATTSDPDNKQLESGLKAGKELIKKYQEHPNKQVTGFKRIWNMGFLQTASGLLTVSWLIWFVSYLLKIPSPL